MPTSQIVLLGAVAGLTIFLGLPIGRIRAPMPRLKVFLSALAIGILIFLLWDVLTAAWGPADEALSSHHYQTAITNGLVMLGCLGVGLMSMGTIRGRRVMLQSSAKVEGDIFHQGIGIEMGTRYDGTLRWTEDEHAFDEVQELSAKQKVYAKK